MHAGQMHAGRRAVVALLSLTLVLAGAAGCGTGGSTPDSKIVSALGLKQGNHAYQIGGDPFCTVDQLLNDADEVRAGRRQAGQPRLPDRQPERRDRRPGAPPVRARLRATRQGMP